MTKYKCGHKMDVVLMNESIIGLSAYLEWKGSVGYDGDKSMCWECYCKDLNKKLKKLADNTTKTKED